MREIEKKEKQEKNVFLFTPGVHVEKNEKTTTTTTMSFWTSVYMCVRVYIKIWLLFFPKKYIFFSRMRQIH